MTTLTPIDPQERIEILDILRGFALLGILFNNMLYFSGYAFVPFDNLKQIINFPLSENIYYFLDIVITAKFYTLFCILFAVGFYIQFSKHREYPSDFLRTYRRRLTILFLIGIIHNLIWFGDILLLYSIMAFILILFRNMKTKNLLRWSIFIILLPLLLDLVVLPFIQVPESAATETTGAVAHVNYPDMAPQDVINTFQNGTIAELLSLNIHNIVWKYLGYIPSGGFFKILGIFILGYYLASIGFFTNKNKSNVLLISSLIVGLMATLFSKLLGGNPYQFPSTLPNIFYKFLLAVGQIFMCIFYITSIFKIVQMSIGKRVLKHLIPVGRMALTNYLSQTIIMIIIFYNFGLNLIGRIGLISVMGIVVAVLVFQIIMSNIWLKHFRFGPFEWAWRSLTYKKKLKIRNEIISTTSQTN